MLIVINHSDNYRVIHTDFDIPDRIEREREKVYALCPGNFRVPDSIGNARQELATKSFLLIISARH